MAYKQGVALCASITMLIGSVALLALYVVCSAISCFALPKSYLAPVWTGSLLLGASFVGIFMSVSKSEKGCGGFFLFLSFWGVVAALGCMGITIIASLWEVGAFPTSSLHFQTTTTPTTNSTGEGTTPAVTAPPTAVPIVGFSLWVAMAGVSLCQFCCCCQESGSRQQNVYVYQQGPTQQPNIILENINTFVAPQAAPQMVVVAGVQPFGQPPVPFVQQSNFPGGMQPQQQFQQPNAFGTMPYPHAAHPPPAQPSPPPQPVRLAPNAPPRRQLTPANPPRAVNSHSPSSNPARYQTTPRHANQIAPISTGNTKRKHRSSNRDDGEPDPHFYQDLITNDARQTSESETQHDYYYPEVLGRENAGFTDAPTTEGPRIEQTYFQGSAPEDNSNRSAPNAGLYEYMDDPSYDYVDMESQRSVSAQRLAGNSYLNDNIAERAKAPNPR